MQTVRLFSRRYTMEFFITSNIVWFLDYYQYYHRMLSTSNICAGISSFLYMFGMTLSFYALQAILGMFIPMFSGGFRFGLFILFTVWSIACAIAAFILYYWNREHIFSSVLYSLPVGALFAETIAVFIYFLEHQTFLFQLLMDIIGAVVFTIIFFKKVNYRKMYIVGIVLSTLVFYYIFPWQFILINPSLTISYPYTQSSQSQD